MIHRQALTGGPFARVLLGAECTASRIKLQLARWPLSRRHWHADSLAQRAGSRVQADGSLRLALVDSKSAEKLGAAGEFPQVAQAVL